MKVRNAIKKVKSHFKKQGIDIEVRIAGHRWTFEHNGYVGSFLANGASTNDPRALDASATNFHVRRVDDHSDPYTDYYAGSFRENITQVCESILPSPPKFPAGSLVRGKQNKRAIRQGYAGRVGLVMSAGGNGYVKVRWSGVGAKPRTAYSSGWPIYPERDLESAT